MADPAKKPREKPVKTYLTDRTLKALTPAKAGKSKRIWDTKLPAFGVTVVDEKDKQRPGKAGRISFILYTRFPGSPHPERRVIGRYGAITLEKARAKAAEWLDLIKKGKDPALEEQRIQRENQRKRKNSFTAAVEDFIERRVIGPKPEQPLQRNGLKVAHQLRSVFVPLWADRPITDITADEVKAAISDVRDLGTERMLASHGVKTKRRGKKGKGGTPGRARNLLAELKAFFRWAVSEGYGLQSSPCAYLSAKTIIGEKTSIDRVLTDEEVAAFWRVTGRMGYPFGPLYQLLLLSGVRLNEMADASWSEFDLPGKSWVVPRERMKGTPAKARAHVVPLVPSMLKIIETLPRFQGDYLFSTTNGSKPVWMTSDVKDRLDAAMLAELKEAAKQRGDDPSKVTLLDWTNHDLRRTLRTNLSKLRVDGDVAEAVLAHKKTGIAGVYDKYDLLDEKMQALELWAARVRVIVEPQPANVVDLKARR
jgi:integrase